MTVLSILGLSALVGLIGAVSIKYLDRKEEAEDQIETEVYIDEDVVMKAEQLIQTAHKEKVDSRAPTKEDV